MRNSLKGHSVYLLLAVFGLLIGIPSCGVDQMEKDIETIEAYLKKNGLVAQKTEEGVYYIIDEEGTGPYPVLQSTVTVHYKGRDTQDRVFDSSYDRGAPATFRLTDVILGWQIGMQKFKEGSKGMLLIPSELAYGENPPPVSGIEKNAVLIFDIDLIQVK